MSHSFVYVIWINICIFKLSKTLIFTLDKSLLSSYGWGASPSLVLHMWQWVDLWFLLIFPLCQFPFFLIPSITQFQDKEALWLLQYFLFLLYFAFITFSLLSPNFSLVILVSFLWHFYWNLFSRYQCQRILRLDEYFRSSFPIFPPIFSLFLFDFSRLLGFLCNSLSSFFSAFPLEFFLPQ